MLDWFESLSLIEQVFVWIAAPASLILIIQTVMLFFGGGSDSDLDSDVSGLHTHDMDMGADMDVDVDLLGHDAGAAHELLDGSTSAGLQFVTMRGIIALLTVFGWTGLCAMQAGLTEAPSIAVATILGFGAMIGIAYLVRGLLRLQSVGNINYREALGQSANVYLTIPPKGKGVGKITLTLGGALREYDAVNAGEAPIKTGETVRVTDLREAVMVVEKED